MRRKRGTRADTPMARLELSPRSRYLQAIPATIAPLSPQSLSGGKIASMSDRAESGAAQVGVRGDAAARHDAAEPAILHSPEQAGEEEVYRGLLEGGGDVGGLRLGAGSPELPELAYRRRLEPRIGQVVAVLSFMERGSREGEGRLVPSLGEGVYGRPSRIAEAVMLRDLVESLAHRIVYSRSEDLDGVEVLDPADYRVPSGDEEADEGIGTRLLEP